MKNKIEIAVDVNSKFGCINKVVCSPNTIIDNETTLELFLCNLFEMIKTEVLNDFREKKERNYIEIK